MKFGLPQLREKRFSGRGSSETLRFVWIAAPILLGLGLAVYLRRKKLANLSRRSITPDQIPVPEPQLPVDEWVSEPQIQSDLPKPFPETSPLLSLTADAPGDVTEAEQNIHRADEFVIPTLTPPWAKLSNPSNDADVEMPTPTPSASSRRGARRIAAAALTFLITAAIVYGTVGAVRSHQKNSGPLLFADATSPPAREAPAEGPNLETPLSDSSSVPPVDQAESATAAENSPALPSESPGPAAANTPSPGQHRKTHGRHSHSRHSRSVNRKTKTPVPWKVSF